NLCPAVFFGEASQVVFEQDQRGRVT
ncbi:MAG: hypothetical protein ACI9ES_002536, partial [Oceanospirillaceae bacterium]